MAESRQTQRQEDSEARYAERERAASAHVHVVYGRSSRAIHEVRASGTSIGRSGGEPGCEIRIDDPRMSRQHSRIERGASGWQLVDLNSRNGAFVDGARTQNRAALVDGSVIRLGDTLLVFRPSMPEDDRNAEAREFPGISTVAARTRDKIRRLASAPGHVLILGETGTGKERVARALAEHRGPGKIVTQNCAELTRELARSELFGHLRGAFTGALHNKRGLVDEAGDGMLFLDEIGELTLDVQGDLLRFLEDGSYRPLGSSELKHSTARVVAATNVDLDRAVTNNKFRRDLLARLRASNEPLELAPLRERREDILQWTRLFMLEAGAAATPETWTVGALECLLLYPWLENLRELRGVVRALVAEEVPYPYPTEKLPERIRAHRATLRDHSDTPPRVEPPAPPRIPTPDEVHEALRQAGGRVRVAALQLGIDRRKLYRLCDRYGIEIEAHRIAEQGEERLDVEGE